MPFLGVYDPDRKKPARQKLAEAIKRYGEKLGSVPTLVLTSAQDAAELAEPTRAHPGELPVRVQARGYMSRYMFYVGQEGDDADAGGRGVGSGEHAAALVGAGALAHGAGDA